MDDDEAAGTPRDRRAERQQRARRQAMAELPKKAAIRGGIALGVVAVLALGVWGFQHLPEGEKTVHWHTGFAVWANGEQLQFTDFAYDLSVMNYGRAHLHVQSTERDQVVHIEGLSGLDCKTWFEFGLRVDMKGRSLRFDGPPYNGRLYENNDTHAWKLYVQKLGAPDWTLVSDMPEYKPKHKDRLLFTFGNETKEGLASQFTSVIPHAQIPD